ncbi:MAG: hypothetical protein AAF694_22220 [Bacteroidota bacterium]
MKKSNAIPNSFKITGILLMLIGLTNPQLFAQSPTMEKTFSLSSKGSLEATTSGGHIYVEGTSGNEVEVDVFVKKDGRLLSSSHELVNNLDDGFDFKMEKNGNDIVLYAKKVERTGRWRNVSISFEVRAPHRISTELKTSGGGLRLSDVEGRHRLATSGGGIRLSDVTGETHAYTSGGGIKVQNQNGDLEAKTSGGGIEIMDSEGDLYAHTSGGGIKLENNKGSVDASTSGGGIRISGTADYVKAGTSGGTIRVDIDGLSKELSLKTSGGSIYASIPSGLGMDLNLKGNRVNMQASNFSGTMKKDRVDGTMNGGGIPIYMSTSGGSVNIDFR